MRDISPVDLTAGDALKHVDMAGRLGLGDPTDDKTQIALPALSTGVVHGVWVVRHLSGQLG